MPSDLPLSFTDQILEQCIHTSMSTRYPSRLHASKQETWLILAVPEFFQKGERGMRPRYIQIPLGNAEMCYHLVNFFCLLDVVKRIDVTPIVKDLAFAGVSGANKGKHTTTAFKLLFDGERIPRPLVINGG